MVRQTYTERVLKQPHQAESELRSIFNYSI
jgi:hypothetical protein